MYTYNYVYWCIMQIYLPFLVRKPVQCSSRLSWHQLPKVRLHREKIINEIHLISSLCFSVSVSLSLWTYFHTSIFPWASESVSERANDLASEWVFAWLNESVLDQLVSELIRSLIGQQVNQSVFWWAVVVECWYLGILAWVVYRSGAEVGRGDGLCCGRCPLVESAAAAADDQDSDDRSQSSGNPSKVLWTSKS